MDWLKYLYFKSWKNTPKGHHYNVPILIRDDGIAMTSHTRHPQLINVLLKPGDRLPYDLMQKALKEKVISKKFLNILYQDGFNYYERNWERTSNFGLTDNIKIFVYRSDKEKTEDFIIKNFDDVIKVDRDLKFLEKVFDIVPAQMLVFSLID